MMQFSDDGKLCKSMINAVFVYGTLKRGYCREKCWPVSPIRVSAGWTFGALYSRDDFPAMLAGDHRVAGECWEFEPDVMERVLRRLDKVEWTNQPGQPDLYHRVIVDVFDADGNMMQSAYGYRYALDPLDDGFKLVVPKSEVDYVAWPEIEGS
jgi:gamma-glutamylcyclotransferase (GGCT)/AIG2-like uncharacterized protein YtfP